MKDDWFNAPRLGAWLTVAVAALTTVIPSVVKAAHEHSSRATTQPGVVSLDVCESEGILHLLLARRVPGEPAALEYLRSGDGGRSWAAAVRLGQSQPPPDPVHRGMDARIAAAGNHLVAAWTTAGTLDKYRRGPIATALSADGGRTWTSGSNPADDGLSTGHAFLDLAADPTGCFHLVWLDSRDRPPDPTGAAHNAGKGLRYARSTDFGATWSRNVTLVSSTCECCWNTIALQPKSGLAVLYRQFSPRDMAVVRSNDNGRTWSKPVTVGAFGWDINACPHVGGGLSFSPEPQQDHAFATVWTARAGAAGGYLLESADGGSTWAAPHLLAGAVPAWHTDVASGRDGRVAIAWDGYGNGDLCVYTAFSPDHGTTWTRPRQINRPDYSASFPRLVTVGNSFRVFWTEIGNDGFSEWNNADVPTSK